MDKRIGSETFCVLQSLLLQLFSRITKKRQKNNLQIVTESANFAKHKICQNIYTCVYTYT